MQKLLRVDRWTAILGWLLRDRKRIPTDYVKGFKSLLRKDLELASQKLSVASTCILAIPITMTVLSSIGSCPVLIGQHWWIGEEICCVDNCWSPIKSCSSLHPAKDLSISSHCGSKTEAESKLFTCRSIVSWDWQIPQT